MNKNLVHGLWIGNNRLTQLEILTLKSFIDMGAEFNLWVYEELKSKLPKEIVLRNANEIIPEEKIFKYPNNMILGFGEGSYVGFSELFRYKVLYEFGGWWTDMDVTCLKPLSEVQDEYWFRFHGVLSMVGNIMKVPAKSELMKLSYEKAIIEVNENQQDWHHAIRILCYYIENLGLSKYIHKNESNLDRLDKTWNLIKKECDIEKNNTDWRFIHWMNSVIEKNTYHEKSVFAHFLKKYNCEEKKVLM